MAQKEAILNQIRDLDFDHQTGKLPEDIDEQQRTQLLPLAAGVLQELDNETNGTLLKAGLYWPGVAAPPHADMRAYWSQNAPVAAITFYRALILSGQTGAIEPVGAKIPTQ